MHHRNERLRRALFVEIDLHSRWSRSPIEFDGPLRIGSSQGHVCVVEPSSALRLVCDRVESSGEWHGDRLAGAYLEGAIGAHTGSPNPTRLLILDNDLLSPPPTEVVLAPEPGCTLAILTVCGTPGIE